MINNNYNLLIINGTGWDRGGDVRSHTALRGARHELVVLAAAGGHVVAIGRIAALSSVQLGARSTHPATLAPHRNFGIISLNILNFNVYLAIQCQ